MDFLHLAVTENTSDGLGLAGFVFILCFCEQRRKQDGMISVCEVARLSLVHFKPFFSERWGTHAPEELCCITFNSMTFGPVAP